MSSEKFNIDPYVGVGPIRFGMTKKEVEALLGKPESVDKDFLGRTNEGRGSISVKYNKSGKVNEISFTDEADVYFNDDNVLKSDGIIKKLEKIEKPSLTVGFKVFFTLGIALTGFSKKKETKTLSVFSKELEEIWKM